MQQRSILFVYPYLDPFDPGGSGGQNRLYNLIQETNKFHKVSVIAPESVVSGDTPAYFSGYVQRTPGFISDIDPGLATVLDAEIKQNNPDVIHIPYPSGLVLSRVISIVNRRRPSLLLDAFDVMSERASQFTNENLGSATDRLRHYYSPALESLATTIADHIITVSKRDAELMTQLNNVPPEKQTVIPNGANLIDLDTLKDQDEVRADLGLSSDDIGVVFHGNCETGTHNLEAARYINDRLGPAFESEAEFFIIGKGAPQSDQENVTTMGFVDDLYSTLHAMDIAAVPLRSGTGTKLKMFDYMSSQLPILSTVKGTEGIDVEEETHVITNELGKDFDAALDRLTRNQELRSRIAVANRRLIKSKYNWEAIGEKLDAVYRDL